MPRLFRRTVIAIVLVVGACVATPTMAMATPMPAPVGTTVQARCYEDMPCWDATRMGNRQVGARVVGRTRDGRLRVTCPRPGARVFVNEYRRVVCQY